MRSGDDIGYTMTHPSFGDEIIGSLFRGLFGLSDSNFELAPKVLNMVGEFMRFSSFYTHSSQSNFLFIFFNVEWCARRSPAMAGNGHLKPFLTYTTYFIRRKKKSVEFTIEEV